MRIIRPGIYNPQEWYVQCRKCTCVFAYEEKDIRHNALGNYVVCPTCNAFIDTSKKHSANLNDLS